MAHFICQGTCRGVSTESDVCQAIECSNYHKQLTACNCADGAHQGKEPEES